MKRILFSLLVLIGLAALFSVMGVAGLGWVTGKEAVKSTFIAIDSKHKPGRLGYNAVKPILESRCATCHAGADAPCQLQLISYEGLQRGASKQPLYETRWQAIAPSRLSLDGKTPEDWRGKGFFPVLNEKSQFPEINLNNSLIAKMLVLKRDHALADANALPRHSGECPSLDDFTAFAQAHPVAGMPYGLPALDKAAQDNLLNWLQDGAKNSPPAALSAAALAEIGKWEQFLNDPAPAVQLTARYIYEHLFSGHLHFQSQPATEFYRLVRSKTAPGLPIEELGDLYPYAAPTASTFAYRLQPVTDIVVDKNHAVYELSDSKMARIKALFLKPDVSVAQLPAYPQGQSAQPFTAFKDLPAAARHQFLLDDAQYFLSAIVKSPALNQHHGLSGWHDQFWVAFVKPRADVEKQTAQFLSETAPFLRLPAAAGENAGLAQWFELKALNKHYLAHKATFDQQVLLKGQPVDRGLLWDGEGSNDNALLTVFRHDDNASVVKGLQGKAPATAWVIGYPLFERLHYLLLAGFTVYGDTAYQLSTRLTLDLLRCEAENNFLQFVPKSARKALHDSWYQGNDSQWLGTFTTPDFAAQTESAVRYASQNYVGELFGKFPKMIPPVPVDIPVSVAVSNAPATATPVAALTTPAAATPVAQVPVACPQPPCNPPVAASEAIPPPLPPEYDNFARQLGELAGLDIAALPEVALLQIRTASNPAQTAVYTLIRNRHLRHVAVLFGENDRHQAELDTLTVLPGVVGSYPNQFFTLTSDKLEAFINQLKQAKTPVAIGQFLTRFGVSRNHPQFWGIYDSFNDRHRDGRPENAGILDVSRYGML